MVRLLSLAFAIVWPAAALAQTGRLAAAGENLRASPDGAILATLEEGTPLRLGRRQGAWYEVTLEAWIWHESVRPDRREPYELVVSARGGENLRAEPNGELLARARTGMLLEEVERAGDWVRVRRTAWIRAAAVRADAATSPDAAAEPVRQASSSPATDPAAAAGRLGPAGAVLLARPGEDTLARLRPGAAVSLGARDGEWVRVRLDGWIRASAVATDSGVASAVLVDVSAAALAEDPGAFTGRVLEWSVQFIALQRAEPIRTDFRAGEYFILARGPAGEAGFVYIAVPPELLAEAERIEPLGTIRVRARIRNAHSPLTGAPILDLLEVGPAPDPG